MPARPPSDPKPETGPSNQVVVSENQDQEGGGARLPTHEDAVEAWGAVAKLAGAKHTDEKGDVVAETTIKPRTGDARHSKPIGEAVGKTVEQSQDVQTVVQGFDRMRKEKWPTVPDEGMTYDTGLVSAQARNMLDGGYKPCPRCRPGP